MRRISGAYSTRLRRIIRPIKAGIMIGAWPRIMEKTKPSSNVPRTPETTNGPWASITLVEKPAAPRRSSTVYRPSRNNRSRTNIAGRRGRREAGKGTIDFSLYMYMMAAQRAPLPREPLP